MVGLIAFQTFGQSIEPGKYIRTDYPSGYLIMNSDHSFKFRFHFDLQWDLACGFYEIKGDKIYFSYNSDMFDEECNIDGINKTDTTGIVTQDAIDKRYRPIIAKYSKRKIITIKTGDISDIETVDSLAIQ